MPFLRSRTTASTRTTMSVGALVVLLVLTSLLPATVVRAETGTDPGTATETGEATLPITVAPSPVVPARFCPQPTGNWWEDVSAEGCRTALAGREGTTPIAARELAWLDLGALPAFATVDVEAIAAAIAAYELRLAEEAAAVQPRAPGGRQPGLGSRRGQSYSDATIDRVLVDCGYHDMTPRSFDEQVRHSERTEACIESNMPGYWDWAMGGGSDSFGTAVDPEQDAYEVCLAQQGSVDILDRAASRAFFDAIARCVDRTVPGHYARWAAEEAKREVELEQALAKEAAAYARLLERRERALQEIRDTCPHGGFASPTQYWVSSYDEVEYVVTCYDGPTG
jgi:hypothetical protein